MLTTPETSQRDETTAARPRAPWSWLIALPAALQFLTVAPPLIRRPFSGAEMGRAVAFFPLVGIFLGLALAGLDVFLMAWFPESIACALLLASWALATGAIHLDGFLDSCDGLFGGRTPEDRLRILRDERVGAYAVIGGVLLLLVKYAALREADERATALILAPTLGRWGMALVLVAFPYARSEGLGRTMKDEAGWTEAALAGAVALLTAGIVGGAIGLAAWLSATAGACAIAWFVLRRLPGLTGDIYGAICELVEVLVLLLSAARIAA